MIGPLSGPEAVADVIGVPVGNHREDHRLGKIAYRVHLLPDLLHGPRRSVHPRRFGDDRTGQPSGDRHKEFTGDRTGFVRQPAHGRGHQVRAHRRICRGVQPLGHAGHRTRHDRIAQDTLGGALQRRHVAQPQGPGLGRGVVGHLMVAVQPADRRGQHHPAVTGLAHEWKCGANHVKCAAQMHVEHRVKIVVAHVLERAATHRAGIVDQDVYPAEALEGGVDDGLAAFRCGHRIGDRYGLSTRRDDFVDNVLCGRGISAVAGDTATRIVDDDLRAPRCQQQRVFTAQSPAAAGDDGDPVVEPVLSTQAKGSSPSSLVRCSSRPDIGS